MIPKPGKKLQLENLRPISLTSCMGKLMEHVVLKRLNKYMEDKDLYPHTMIGFRPKLSTQDVLLQLKHHIIDGNAGSSRDTKAILGLDLTKAFDNVRHSAILENLEALGIGSRTYNYVRDFLSDRTGKLRIGAIEPTKSNWEGGDTAGIGPVPFLVQYSHDWTPGRNKENRRPTP